MRNRLVAAVALLVLISGSTSAKDLLPFRPTAGSQYFDFWPGDWHKVVDGERAKTVSFRVRRSVHPAAYIEDWTQVIDGKTLTSIAIRAWDKTNERWMFTWVSDNGLYQVWEGRKTGDDWYIYKEFEIKGERYLSRQAWIPSGPNRLTRISEKSTDGGATWTLRFREEYVKDAKH